MGAAAVHRAISFVDEECSVDGGRPIPRAEETQTKGMAWGHIHGLSEIRFII